MAEKTKAPLWLQQLCLELRDLQSVKTTAWQEMLGRTRLSCIFPERGESCRGRDVNLRIHRLRRTKLCKHTACGAQLHQQLIAGKAK
ncbi:hypothetical protein GN956_G17699 [Arapaima gigas]